MRDPMQYEAIVVDSADFNMASDKITGQWLRAVAAGKGNGRFLELGTGTGLSACWILDGMDAASTLLTIDSDAELMAIAKKHLAHDPRLEFVLEDGAETLRGLAGSGQKFDYIFADTWPGKFYGLDLALSLLDEHGVYLIDDLLPQPNWPAGHASKVQRLIDDLNGRASLACVLLNTSTDLMMCTKLPATEPKN